MNKLRSSLTENAQAHPHFSLECLWEMVCGNLRSRLKPEIFRLWFAPLRPRCFDGRSLVLETPNEYFESWLKNHYLDLLQETISQVIQQPAQVVFEAAASHVGSPTPHASTPEPPPPSAPKRTPATAVGVNPKKTFESFVVGDNNNFAHAACVAVANAPGRSYNPLFLYGGVGLGKTHLLHAVTQHVLNGCNKYRVVYLTSEQFTNEYISAIQGNQLSRFRRKYRHTDLLLIDDIQFLAGKERIQEEFFHTFNALHEKHKQIVLTCDRPAHEIKNLQHRLVSRFECGMASDLQPPSIETRLAILRKKVIATGVDVSDELLFFLADRIRSNVRRLEGALNRVTSFTLLTNRPMTLAIAENLLRDVLQEEGRPHLNIEHIQKRVIEYFGLRMADMTSKRRMECIAFPRQIAMYLSRELTDSSLSTIGEAFGGRDHGTVLHGCRHVHDRMQVDPEVRSQVEWLHRELLK